MSGHTWSVKNKDQAKAFCEFIMAEQDAGKEFTYTIKEMKRSDLQNAALHAMFRRLSIALNDAGYDMKSDEITKREIPWSEHSIKEVLFRPMIKHMFDTDRSSSLTKEELSHGVETLLREIGARAGVHVPFSLEDIKKL